MKTTRQISIDAEINNSIKARKQKYGFNFSDWIEDTYKKQFLDVDMLKTKKQKYIQNIRDIDLKIKEIEDRDKAYSSGLSRHEIRFLKEIPRLLSEGKNREALCGRFNRSFHREWTIEKFVKTFMKLVI